MAIFRAKLKELRNADVRYISLVDRAATRIPFRVLKRDKENQMGIDLTSVFKSDDTVKPCVSALVVFAHPDEAVTTAIREAIKKEGFAVDRVQKSDEGQTLLYAQGDQPSDVQIVRLGDQVLASVGGLQMPSGWMGDLVEEYGFFPDLKMATAALYDQMEHVSKSETPQADASAMLTSFGEYLAQMMVLPAACYGLDQAISAIVQKAAPSLETDAEEEAEKKKKKEEANPHYPSETAPEDEDDDQKGPPEDVAKADVKKADVKKTEKPVEAKKTEKSVIDGVLAALKGMEERTTVQLSGLSKKLETVVSEQATQKKVLDDVVQKSDTLSKTLKATVTAAPVAEDRPAGGNRVRVEKNDDPRTGNFDTAFLRRRR